MGPDLGLMEPTWNALELANGYMSFNKNMYIHDDNSMDPALAFTNKQWGGNQKHAPDQTRYTIRNSWGITPVQTVVQT